MIGDRDYSESVWAHFLRPRHAGAWAPGPDTGCGEAGTPASGAVLKIQVWVRAERIVDARFQAYGCVSTIAAGSWLAAWLHGRRLSEARALEASEIDAALALAPEKRFCALLAEDALRAALGDYQGRIQNSSYSQHSESGG